MFISRHQNAARIVILKAANVTKSLKIVEHFKVYKIIILPFSYNGDGILYLRCQMMGNVQKPSSLILSVVLRFFICMGVNLVSRPKERA
jgi:hypothetical protein